MVMPHSIFNNITPILLHHDPLYSKFSLYCTVLIYLVHGLQRSCKTATV